MAHRRGAHLRRRGFSRYSEDIESEDTGKTLVTALLFDVCIECGAVFSCRHGRHVPLEMFTRQAAQAEQHPNRRNRRAPQATHRLPTPVAERPLDNVALGTGAKQGLEALRKAHTVLREAPVRVWENGDVVHRGRSMAVLKNPRFPVALVHPRSEHA